MSNHRDDKTKNGWNEYEKLVMSELRRLDKDVKQMNEKLDKILLDMTAIKTRSKMWGVVAGALASLAIVFFEKFISLN